MLIGGAAQDGSWPVESARHLLLVRFGAHPQVAFHDSATASEAWQAAEQPRQRMARPQTPGGLPRPPPRLLRSYTQLARASEGSRRGREAELVLPERPRWQLEQTAAELQKWLLEASGIQWPAGWACCRVADVMSAVRAEQELAALDRELADTEAAATGLAAEREAMSARLPELVACADVAARKLTLAAIEQKFSGQVRRNASLQCLSLCVFTG